MATPYSQVLANQEAQRQALLKQQQQQQSFQQKEEERKNNIAVQALAADSLLNNGEGRKAAGEWLANQIGLGSSTTTAANPTIGQALNPGVDPATGFTLNADPLAPVEAGTPSFAIGEPSGAGYVAGAVRGVKGVQRFLNPNQFEKDRNRQAVWDASMTGANIITGGLAEFADMGLQKALSKGQYKELQNIVAFQTPSYWVAQATGSGKDRDQFNRDSMRKELQKNGFVDDAFNVTLADGSKFNIGVDGKAKPDYGVNSQTGKPMHAFDLDHADPLVKKLVPLVNPLVNVLSGGNAKLASDFTGYLVRAAMSNSGGDFNKAFANIQGFYGQLKASPQALSASIDKMLSEKTIDAQTAQIWKNDINRATAGMNFGNSPISGIGGSQKVVINYPAPKPVPQPYQRPSSANSFTQAISQPQQSAQGSNIGSLYSNFARNFIPQSQGQIRSNNQ